MSLAEPTPHEPEPEPAANSTTPTPQSPQLHWRQLRRHGVLEQHCPRCDHDTVRQIELIDEHGQLVASTARCSRCAGRHRRADQP